MPGNEGEHGRRIELQINNCNKELFYIGMFQSIYLSLAPLLLWREHLMSLVSVLATLLANTLLVIATKQVQWLVVLRTRSGLHLGQLRVNTVLWPRTRQDVQINWDGRWRRARFNAVSSQFLHCLHQHGAFGQRGPRLEHLPTLGAAVLAVAVLLVPVALNAGQAVRVSAGQGGWLRQSVQAH